MLDFHVDGKRCTRCGWCVQDCPARIVARSGEGVPAIAPEDEEKCLACQHCLAVCPTGALGILGRDPDRSLPLGPGTFPPLEQMDLFVRGRRSVRHYRDGNVPRALLDRLMQSLANTPTGSNARELTFTLVDDRAVMKRFQDRSLEALRAALPDLPERFAFLRDLVVNAPEAAIALLFRGAPHALIVSAPPDALCADQDVPLCLAYFEFLAQSAGLGTVWWGLLKMILENAPELKALLGLPADHVYYAMLFGLPAVRYARTVQRDDAAVVRRVEL